MANTALLCGFTALGLERVPAVGLAPIHVGSSNTLVPLLSIKFIRSTTSYRDGVHVLVDPQVASV